MQKLNSSFMKLHGASSMSNLIGLGALLVYGFTLVRSLDVGKIYHDSFFC